jgi:DNA-binding winged helix-turn-helix (wHTH) protein
MTTSSQRFGEFELDRSRFELRRNGRVVKLERIPMELLLLLVEKDGSVVTRQEIVDRLWGKDVFVDTEHGINIAIRKVRQALKDDPDNSRFVQTVSGKGYRFVAETNGRPSGSALTEAPRSMERPAPRPPESPEPMWRQPSRKPALSEVEGSGGAEVSRRPGAIENAAPEPASTKTKMIAEVAICLAAATALIFPLPRSPLSLHSGGPNPCLSSLFPSPISPATHLRTTLPTG